MQADFIVKLLSHYRELKHFLTRELRNADDASDIAQSSFERAYLYIQSRHGQDPEAGVESPRALLYRVAKNLCIDEQRHRKVAAAWREQHQPIAPGHAPSAEYLVAQRQLVARVMQELEQLPAKRREVFLLFRAYGHSQKEIAARLDITEATVGKHILRATLDCARVFAELRALIPTEDAVAAEPSSTEECYG